MKHFLLTYNQRLGGYASDVDALVDRQLAAARRDLRIASWLTSAALILGLCALCAYIFAEAAFGAGSIVQFSSK
jgi:predicted benzoate:H+ symporter BenE